MICLWGLRRLGSFLLLEGLVLGSEGWKKSWMGAAVWCYC